MKIVEFANTFDPAQNELPHLDLHCLPSTYEFAIWYSLDHSCFYFFLFFIFFF